MLEIRDSAEVALARSKITQILNNSRIPPPNLPSNEIQALGELRNDPSIKIMKADKGNSTVIMNTDDYHNKLMLLLNDSNTYQILPAKPNPINAIQQSVNKLLLRFFRENKINPPTYYFLKCDKGVTPKVYGLPKIHKPNLPLRPIVSFIGSPTYNLSRYLVNILSPLLNHNHSVKNSSEFVQIINRCSVDDLDCFVSFDVVSLFTSVPLQEISALISNLLSRDESLVDRTKLSVGDIMEALELCFKSTVFCYNDVLYRQIFGTPMGSCISPVVADIFMEHLENRAMSAFHTPPSLWLRYVDDTFCIIKHSVVDDFHDFLNKTTCLTFTVEHEANRAISFLDVAVTRTDNNLISTTVYKKPTHTDRYLHFDSHHPKHQKLAVARTLYNRSVTHIANPTERQRYNKEVRRSWLQAKPIIIAR